MEKRFDFPGIWIYNIIMLKIKDREVGEGSKIGEIDFKTVNPEQRSQILGVAGENFTKQLKAYVSTLDKSSKSLNKFVH